MEDKPPAQAAFLWDDVPELRDIELPAQVAALEKLADQLERRAYAVRQIVAGVRALQGNASAGSSARAFVAHRTLFEVAPRDREGPRGPEAVLRVMSEHPDRTWKVVELKRELLRRGWAPTPKAVEASVKRLRLASRVEAVSYGHYRLVHAAGELHATERSAA